VVAKGHNSKDVGEDTEDMVVDMVVLHGDMVLKYCTLMLMEIGLQTVDQELMKTKQADS
jgi:hypothetical protein